MRRFRGVALAATCMLLVVGSACAEERVSPEDIPGAKKIDAEGVIDLAEKMATLKIVDSRIASDRLQGFIEGSVSLPDEKTTCNSLAEIAPKKDQPTMFYCNGPKCGRSAVAVQIALGCGYKDVYWFRGGFEEWKNKRYPYVKE